MKRFQNTSLFFLFTVLLVGAASCYKDKGNYEYIGVNKISIVDPRTTAPISIRQGDTLKLTPTITQSLEPNEDSLSYRWTVYANDPGTTLAAPEILLDSTRNLTRVITDPPFTLGIEYKIIYRVFDKKTGVSSLIIYTIKIDNEFSQGWMFLEDKGGTGDLSMLLPSGKLITNVYSDRNKNSPLGKPVKLEIPPLSSITDDLSPSGRRIYILYENGGLELNYQTMLKKFDYNHLFFTPPPVVKPEILTWVSSSTATPPTSSSLGVAINNGLVHSNLVGGFPGSKKWGERLLSGPGGDLNYKTAPFVAGGTSYVAVVYDNTNKRFAFVPTSTGVTATYLNPFPASASNPATFDMNNVGMTMLFMDSANVVREYNAIMKDNSNAPYLLRFKTVATVAAPVITLQKTAMNAPEILNMTSAAGVTNSPHIFYGAGNQLYRYETTSNTTVPVLAYNAGENVTKIESRGSVLLVATWNGNAGTVYFYDLSPTGAHTLSKTVNGFARIVDMAYKNP